MGCSHWRCSTKKVFSLLWANQLLVFFYVFYVRKESLNMFTFCFQSRKKPKIFLLVSCGDTCLDITKFIYH